MATIYRKTEKGRLEVDTRTHRLSPRLRAALILVDGQRSQAELAKLVASNADVFDTLVVEGFIEPMASSRRRRAEDTDKTQPLPVLRDSVDPLPLAASPAKATLADVPAAESVGTSETATRRAPTPEVKVSDLVRRRTQAVLALTDAVGVKSRALTRRIEQANDEMKLRPLLVQARNLIASTKGADAANTFVTRFLC